MLTRKLLVGFILVYLVFLLFVFLEYKYQFYIYDSILVLVVITLFGHFFLGENLGYYYKTIYYDRFLHLFGTIAFTLFTYSVITLTIHPNINTGVFVFIFVLSLGGLIGVVFEIIEFILDSIFKTRNQSGLIDTNFDLIFDLIGAAIAGIIIVYFQGKYF